MSLSTDSCDKGTLGLREMLSAERVRGVWIGRQRVSTVVDMAASSDLGFVAGAQAGGSYVTVMARSTSCAWQAVLDENINHRVASTDRGSLIAEQVEWVGAPPPAPQLLAEDASGSAMSEFREVLREEGLAAALRTYGRNNDFRLYLEGSLPFEGVDAANGHLTAHAVVGQLQERTRARSADGSFAYSLSEFRGSHGQDARRCLQLWQYDAKVANWGVRVLLLSRVQPDAVG